MRMFLVLCLFAAAACNHSSPTGRDLAATWTIAEESWSLLSSEYRAEKVSLSLRSDGTFDAVDLPGELLYIEKPARDSVVSGSGRWELKREELTLDFTETNHAPRSTYRTSMLVEGDQQNPLLYYYSGDPDEGRRIYFVRAAERR